MEGTCKYIHGDCGEEGKFNNFSSAALQDLHVTGYYIGKSSLVASFSDIFSKCFPTGALAFSVTALTATMDEYVTGALVAIKFCHEGYSKVNEQFLDIITNIKTMQGCAKNPVIGVGSVTTSVGQHEFTGHLD
ncbi:hypothetical protein EDC04DRAFT_2612077 [Pisolithus marmoratus]|nr:hypothetical protein EDC04DRAFT_2612077 [Pisolithus marmoratus]